MAIEFDKPSNLDVIWASAGDVLNPGDTKYSTGWAVEVPPRQWENYIQNKQDQAIAHFNQHGVSVWDSVSQYLASKSYVQGPTTGAIYRAKVDNVAQNPELDTAHTYWSIAFASPGDFYTKAESDSTFLKKANNLSDLTDLPTARNNLSVYSKAETYTKTEVDAKTTVASTSQAQAGVSNVVLMTPLRTKEYADSNMLGVGQTWQDMTAGRALGVTYTNSANRPIQVFIDVVDNGTTTPITLNIGGISWAGPDPTAGSVNFPSFVVPNGATYSISGGITLRKWLELR